VRCPQKGEEFLGSTCKNMFSVCDVYVRRRGPFSACSLNTLHGKFKGPSTTTFSSPWGEFKGIFIADRSGKCRAVLNLILLDAFGLHEPFYGPGQCFRVFLNGPD